MDDESQQNPKQPKILRIIPDDTVGGGFSLGLLAHIVFPLILVGIGQVPFIGDSSMLPVWFIGVGQLLWMGPVMIWSYKNKKSNRLKGLAILSAITFLLNGSCTLWFFNNFRS